MHVIGDLPHLHDLIFYILAQPLFFFAVRVKKNNLLLRAGYSSYPEDLKQQLFSKSPDCQHNTLADAVTENKILADNGIEEIVAWRMVCEALPIRPILNIVGCN